MVRLHASNQKAADAPAEIAYKSMRPKHQGSKCIQPASIAPYLALWDHRSTQQQRGCVRI